MARAAVQALALVALVASAGSATATQRRLPRLYTAPILFDSNGLYRMNGDGSGLRALPGGHWAGARLSPNGQRIALACSNAEGSGICVMDAHGADVRQLTPSFREGAASGPAWAPDSHKVVFSRYLPAQGLYTVDLEGQMRRLTSGLDADAVWSPDGRRIAFSRERQTKEGRLSYRVHVMSVDGTQDRALGESSLPRWSPDGRWLSFVLPGYGLFKVRSTGGRPIPLAPDVQVDSYNWSPDGRMLIFAAGADVDACCGVTQIGLVTSTGMGPWWLTKARGSYTDEIVIYQDSPVWSPSGKRLAFVRVVVDYTASNSDPDVTTEIWSMDLNGRHRRQLTSRRHQARSRDHQYLTWAPSSTNEQHDRSFGND